MWNTEKDDHVYVEVLLNTALLNSTQSLKEFFFIIHGVYNLPFWTTSFVLNTFMPQVRGKCHWIILCPFPGKRELILRYLHA